MITITLHNPGPSKLAVVKSTKEHLGIGLKDAKDLIDSAPWRKDFEMTQTQAEEFVRHLTECGSEIEYTDAAYVRTKKLVELGLGDRESMIDVLIEESMNKVNRFDMKSVREELFRIYTSLSDEELERLT